MTREEALTILNVSPKSSSEEIEQKATELAGDLEIKIGEAQTPEFAIKLRRRRADVLLARDVLLNRLPNPTPPPAPPDPAPSPDPAMGRVLVKVTERCSIMLNGALMGEATPEAPLVLTILEPGDQLIRAIPIASESEPRKKVVTAGHGHRVTVSFGRAESKPRRFHWVTGALVLAVVIGSISFALAASRAPATSPDIHLLQESRGRQHSYVTQDSNLRLSFGTSDDTQVKSSFVAFSNVSIKAEFEDPDGEAMQEIEVWGAKAGQEGSPATSPSMITSNDASNVLVAPLPPPAPGDWYYYVKGVQADGNVAYSSPMWITWPVMSEDAEHGATGWMPSKRHRARGWWIEESSRTGSISGTHRFRTPVAARQDYGNSGNWDLVSPEFSLSGKTQATLRYYSYYYTEKDRDYLTASISTDGGETWTQLGLFSGNHGQWHPVSIPLDKYLGEPAVKIRFRFTTSKSKVDWGVALDDIAVTAN